jgi:hypothetical protein
MTPPLCGCEIHIKHEKFIEVEINNEKVKLENPIV